MGNTYSEYKCRICGKIEVIDMEDPGPTQEGCFDDAIGTPHTVPMEKVLETIIHDNLMPATIGTEMAKRLVKAIMPVIEQRIGHYVMEIDKITEQLKLYKEQDRNK